jgi:restriction system protein
MLISMGRKRRHEEEGLIGMLMDLSAEVPVAGFISALLFLIAGAYLTWINPKVYYGMGAFFGDIAFLLSALLALVAVIGLVRQRKSQKERHRRLDAVVSAADLQKMDWKQFEQLVADAFRRQGFRVREVGGSGDGGVDLVLVGADSREHLVQCKQYRVWDVGEPRVREFYGAMAAHRTRCEGIIVTCGRFTEPARRFAEDKPLRLMDGEALVKLIGNANAIAPAVSHFIGAPEVPSRAAAPICPRCGIAMVGRTAKKGLNAGQPFWGCKNFPNCREIVPIGAESGPKRR